MPIKWPQAATLSAVLAGGSATIPSKLRRIGPIAHQSTLFFADGSCNYRQVRDSGQTTLIGLGVGL
jgi:hypothetical protein